MSGSLQQRMVGGSRFGSSTGKRMGSYNQGAMKRLGHTNGLIKRLGVYNGSGGSKNPMMEIYPRG
jgi:hypothetical protein